MHFEVVFYKKVKAHNANHPLLKWLMVDGGITPKAHQPDGLLQSAIFHTNLWEKYLLEILKCVVTTRFGSRGYSDLALFRRWVFISPLVFEIVMKFIHYGALSITGLSIRDCLCFKYNEGNALNV